MRFTQSGGTSTVKNCRTASIRVKFTGNQVGAGVVDSSCRTLSPGASTSIQDALLVHWKQWSYC
ncbi:hypothetical protein AB6V29_01360 [Microbacterium sp. 20-116]